MNTYEAGKAACDAAQTELDGKKARLSEVQQQITALTAQKAEAANAKSTYQQTLLALQQTLGEKQKILAEKTVAYDKAQAEADRLSQDPGASEEARAAAKEQAAQRKAEKEKATATEAAAQAEEYLQEKMKELDSCGGIVECVITGMPVGVGEPVFDKLSANLGKAILSIGAVKGFEIGDGFAAAASAGSENNDDFYNDNGTVKKKTNHAGGVLGGMSDGSVITFRAAFKPTPSIAQSQQTVNRDGKDTEIVIHGRHDPIIVPRAVVVVETMAAVTVLDLLLQNMGSRLDSVKNFYENEKK